LQYYGQPFISKGTYQHFNRTTENSLGKNFSDRFLLFEDVVYDPVDELYLIDENGDGAVDYNFENPDFNFIQFRSNLVFRWEYVPGSELFLVWSQGANASADPEAPILRSLSDNLFGENAQNIFLLKATYRFLR
jgi:hypothetical protein